MYYNCFPCCDINFEIKLSFLIKPFSHINMKSGQKFIYLENEKSFYDGLRLSLDINISTKYVYVRKHTHNKNEKATEIMFCECNEN